MLPLWRCPLRRGLFALAGLTLALAVPRFVAASIVVPATLDELAGDAQLIVHARVARIDTRQAPGTLRVERVVSLDVLRAFKGSPDVRVVVVLPGGSYGRYRTVVPGVPELSDGDEAVLFLRTSASDGPHLVGFTQGFLRVRVDPETGQRTVAAPVVGGADGAVVRGATDRGPQPLARIEARIAHVVLAQLRGRR